MPPISIWTPYLIVLSIVGSKCCWVWEEEREDFKGNLDRLYNIQVQVGYLPIKNESSLKKGDNYYKFHKKIGRIVDKC
jgi:hypothetical protein